MYVRSFKIYTNKRDTLEFIINTSGCSIFMDTYYSGYNFTSWTNYKMLFFILYIYMIYYEKE